jgi:hypothetical protein
MRRDENCRTDGHPLPYEGRWTFAGNPACPFDGEIVVAGAAALVRLKASRGATAFLASVAKGGSFATEASPFGSLKGRFTGDAIEATLATSACGNVSVVGKRA